jgi:hypothetical protein
MLFMYLEGTEKYLQDFRRPAYNAVLKWKPKSELSRVSNSAQTRQLHISMNSYMPEMALSSK